LFVDRSHLKYHFSSFSRGEVVLPYGGAIPSLHMGRVVHVKLLPLT